MPFMIHPKHGAIITTAVEEHQKQGWTLADPIEWVKSKDQPVEENADPKPKRGRPPKAK